MPLSARQTALLEGRLPGHEVVADHGWGLVGTTVLQIRHDGADLIVKAGDDADTHIARELRAHREWLAPLVARGRAPELRHADADAKLLVTRYLPGALVQDTPAEHEPSTYRGAGELLALLHDRPAVVDEGYGARLRDTVLARLGRPHRIAPGLLARLRAEVAGWPTPAARLVPTHGDWHPRNWLVHDGVVAVIDLGRAALRPASTDLVRLAARQFRWDPALETAHHDGYGGDPRESGPWRREWVAEAVGTVTWALEVGDEPFEAHGHRMLAEAFPD